MQTKITSVILVLFFVLLNALSLKATHLAGGSITYKCVGGNSYTATITIYRDCKGVALATPVLSVVGCGNTFTVSYTGPSVTPVLITPSCNATVKTACDIPPGTAPGIQRFDYSFNYTLPAPLAACSDVTFFYDVAARNAAITTLNNPNQNLRVEAHLNPVAAPCNTSPTFNNDPGLFFCLNQNNITDCSVKLLSCDSLSYSLMCPLTAGGICITYNPGYDPQHFITGTILLNSSTGLLSVTPTASGEVAVYAVKITQWKKISGVWTKIGWIERDIQIYVIACTNYLPTITGIDSTNQYSTTIAADKTTCLNVYSADADAADTISLSWNNEIPTASFSATTTAKRNTGLFCWQPTMADTGCAHCFTVKAKDNACPQNGVSYSRYCISVTDSLTLKTDLIDQKYFITVSPNPFSKATKINLSNSSQLMNIQFTLTDIFGRNVMNKKMEKNELVIERGNLAEGIYFYSIHDNDKIIAAGKILIVE